MSVVDGQRWVYALKTDAYITTQHKTKKNVPGHSPSSPRCPWGRGCGRSRGRSPRRAPGLFGGGGDLVFGVWFGVWFWCLYLGICGMWFIVAVFVAIMGGWVCGFLFWFGDWFGLGVVFGLGCLFLLSLGWGWSTHQSNPIQSNPIDQDPTFQASNLSV